MSKTRKLGEWVKKDTTATGEEIELKNSAIELGSNISGWYVALRDLALVAMMCVLLYIGIRMVISSSSESRAKYKERLWDWVVGMSLLFVLHYFMAFANFFVEELSKGVNSACEKCYIKIGTKDGKLGEYIYSGTDEFVFDAKDGYGKAFTEAGIISNDVFIWPTNLMGKARIELQLDPKEKSEDGEEVATISPEDSLMRQFGYTVIYAALVMYTILFLFRYLKRLLMLTFLTIIAPFMAMTYPLDKISDGKANGFNTWFKEYLYNLLIQPVHLILYTLLIGTAMDFAADNLLYSLAALGFILQAEKIMRKLFGFEKASTIASGSALGGALAMQGLNMIGKIGKGNKGKEKDGKKGNKPIRQANDSTGNDENRGADKGKNMSDLLNGQQEDNDVVLDGGNDSNNGAGKDKFSQGLSDEGRRIEWERQKINGLSRYSQDKGTIAEMKADLADSDTRTLGEYVHDKYQGSGAQKIVNKVGNGLHSSANMVNSSIKTVGNTKPIRFVRNQVTKGANGIRDIKEKTNNMVRRIPKPIRSSVRTATQKFGETLKGTGAVLAKGTAYAAPKVAKGFVKGTVAGAGAILGAAGGLVSEDYSNVLKWGAAGAGSGLLAGSSLTKIPGEIGDISDGISNVIESASSAYTAATKGEDAEKARQQANLDVAARNDKNAQKLYKDKFGIKNKKDLNKILDERQKYRSMGITDDKIIMKAMNIDKKGVDFGEGRASNEKIMLAALSQEVGKDEKKLENKLKQLEKYGIDEKMIRQYEKGIKQMNNWTIQ